MHGEGRLAVTGAPGVRAAPICRDSNAEIDRAIIGAWIDDDEVDAITRLLALSLFLGAHFCVAGH